MLSDKSELSVEAEKGSDYFFRSLVIVAIVSIVAILALCCFGTYWIYSRHIIMGAEDDAAQVGEALLKREEQAILKGNKEKGYFIGISAEGLPQLDTRLREFLRPFGILKIKIYDEKRTIVYSTDRPIIGKNDSGNPRLARALVGLMDSKLEDSEDVLDLAEEKRFDVDVVETYVPIKDQSGHVVGAFEVYMDVSKYVDQIHKVVMSTFAILFVVLLLVFGCAFLFIRRMTNRLREAEGELKRIAITDPLTGIANRRHIMQRAAEEFARLLRKQYQHPDYLPLGVVMIDVDHFKRINDTFGHGAGDAVLKEIAHRIASTLRQYDSLGRYGGEEFLVILPETELEEAWHIAERIRRHMAEGPVIVDNKVIQVTLSLGIASVLPGETDYQPALKRADKALYQAKDAGRNRVMSVEDVRYYGDRSRPFLEVVKA